MAIESGALRIRVGVDSNFGNLGSPHRNYRDADAHRQRHQAALGDTLSRFGATGDDRILG